MSSWVLLRCPDCGRGVAMGQPGDKLYADADLDREPMEGEDVEEALDELG